MITTILEVVIPIFYFAMATQWARYVARTTRADEDEKNMHGLLVGAFWPVTIPFYIALHESETEHLERVLEKQEEIEHWKRMTYKSLSKWRGEE